MSKAKKRGTVKLSAIAAAISNCQRAAYLIWSDDTVEIYVWGDEPWDATIYELSLSQFEEFQLKFSSSWRRFKHERLDQ